MKTIKLMLAAIWAGLVALAKLVYPSGYPPLTPDEAEEFEFLSARAEWNQKMTGTEALRYIELYEKARMANGR